MADIEVMPREASFASVATLPTASGAQAVEVWLLVHVASFMLELIVFDVRRDRQFRYFDCAAGNGQQVSAT
jgi:hypothetical protein